MIEEIFENYKQLLKAIFNTDDKTTGHGIICVYDLKEQEKLIAIFTNGNDCAKFFGTTRQVINSIICRNEIYKRRFKIIRLKKGWNADESNR